MNANDPNWNLHHCSGCGYEVDGPSQLSEEGLCGTCARQVPELTPEIRDRLAAHVKKVFKQKE